MIVPSHIITAGQTLRDSLLPVPDNSSSPLAKAHTHHGGLRRPPSSFLAYEHCTLWLEVALLFNLYRQYCRESNAKVKVALGTPTREGRSNSGTVAEGLGVTEVVVAKAVGDGVSGRGGYGVWTVLRTCRGPARPPKLLLQKEPLKVSHTPRSKQNPGSSKTT